MHGIPRKAPTQEERDDSSLKAAKLRDLQSQLLHFHHNKIKYTKEAIEISAKLLESNPEHYTGWNYRKLAVQHLLDQQKEIGTDSESVQPIFDEELRIDIGGCDIQKQEISEAVELPLTHHEL